MNDSLAFHLSTNLCPAHRQGVLETVRARLAAGDSVRLVATQCVEAGVDVDFPMVFRAWGPLEAIIQAAGRCNREGKRTEPGRVRVFLPEDEGYPPGGYEQATQIAKMLYERARLEKAKMDLDNPHFVTGYYRELYSLAGIEKLDKTRNIIDAVRHGSFPDVARLYRVIDQDAINVLVPYDAQLELYDTLHAEAEDRGLTAAWTRRARSLTVSLYRPKDSHPIWDTLLPVPVAGWRRPERNDWFIHTRPEHYHSHLGLVPPDSLNTWIA